MSNYSLSHLSNGTLLRDLATLIARDRTTTAALLAHLAEVDARRLYAPAGYPSMFAYCVGELRLSEASASKRIHAARAARRFPAIFSAVAEGRLHLSAVCLLAPHLSPENAEELMAAAVRRSKAEVEQLLAERFPRPDVEARVVSLSPPQHAPGHVQAPNGHHDHGHGQALDGRHAPGHVQASGGQQFPEHPEIPARQLSPGTVELPRPRVTPLAPERFALQLTMSRSTHDKLRHAQALLGHSVPSGDIAQVLDRALDALIRQLEKRKFAATDRPRSGPRRATASGRYIPAHVRRAVWVRDGGQCTFVSAGGQRCPARTRLEFDHIDPVARGGQATVGSIRLRCRAHNQYDAECALGAGFMHEKRGTA